MSRLLIVALTTSNFKITESPLLMEIQKKILNLIKNLLAPLDTEDSIILTISKLMIRAVIYLLALIIQGTAELGHLMSTYARTTLILILISMALLINSLISMEMVT